MPRSLQKKVHYKNCGCLSKYGITKDNWYLRSFDAKIDKFEITDIPSLVTCLKCQQHLQKENKKKIKYLAGDALLPRN